MAISELHSNPFTDNPPVLLEEYLNLVKIKKFHMEKENLPFQWTYQSVFKALEQEYTANIREKLNRWIDVTNASYFKNSIPVAFYFQAKMLYRDGYYEAAIAVTRNITEMICYDFLSRLPHPFGSQEEIEQLSPSLLAKFLAVPKTIPIEAFTALLQYKTSQENENILKSSYDFDTTDQQYYYQIERGKKAENLNKLHTLLNQAGFNLKGIFPKDTYQKHKNVYELGSTYAHVRKSTQLPKTDAKTCLEEIGYVLAHLYIVEGISEGQKIQTGYDLFPDICKGTNFFPAMYSTPEEAQRSYYNAPSREQHNRLLSLSGNWSGAWKDDDGQHQQAGLDFISGEDTIHCKLQIMKHPSCLDNIEIRLFGDYFHLLVRKKVADSEKLQLILKFELSIFSDKMLIGKEFTGGSQAYFSKNS